MNEKGTVIVTDNYTGRSDRPRKQRWYTVHVGSRSVDIQSMAKAAMEALKGMERQHPGSMQRFYDCEAKRTAGKPRAAMQIARSPDALRTKGWGNEKARDLENGWYAKVIGVSPANLQKLVRDACNANGLAWGRDVRIVDRETQQDDRPGDDTATQLAEQQGPVDIIQMRLYWQQSGLCGGCGSHMLAHAITQDHIKPRRLGGGDEFENLQLLCGGCSSIKGDRTQEEFEEDLNERYIRYPATMKRVLSARMMSATRAASDPNDLTPWTKSLE